MSSADFTRIESVHCFLKSDTIYYHNEKEARNIDKFFVSRKIQKHMKLIFLTGEIKKERKAKIGETACQNNSRSRK